MAIATAFAREVAEGKKLCGGVGALVAAVIGLLGALPLFSPALPKAHDILFHLYRLAQLDALWRRGVFFSRWAPDLAYGYGFPLFNYYAPLAYYLVQPFHLLGLSLTHALLAAFVLFVVLGAVFTYLWIRELFGEAGALIAAAAYTFTPYMMETMLNRGSLAEQLALTLMPATLWLFERYVTQRRSRDALLAALAYAALILSHNVSALLFSPLLAVYLLARVGVLSRSTGDRRAGPLLLLSTGALVALALGLTAFFWLPALQERDLVQIHQLYIPTVFDYRANFLKAGQLFALPRPFDPLLAGYSGPLAVNWIALLLGGVGICGAVAKQRHRLLVAVGALTCAGSLLMILPLSAPVWEAVPGLHILQFPWRLLSIASLSLALLAGSGGYVACAMLRATSARHWIAPAAVLAMGVYIMPWQYAHRLPPLGDVAIADYAAIERRSGWIGTTTMGEYLPATVHVLPPEDSPTVRLKDACLNTASLPVGSDVLSLDCAPTRYRLEVESPIPFAAVFHTFYFPGWQVRVDGKPAAAGPTAGHGFLSVELPAGRQRVEVVFGAIPSRAWATGLSLLSLVALTGVGAGVPRLPSSGAAARKRVHPSTPLPPRHHLWLLGGLALLAILKLGYLDHHETPFRRTRFDGRQVAGAGHPLHANFSHELLLIGADVPAAASGTAAEVTLYWRLLSRTPHEYSVSMTVVDAQGRIFGNSDKQHLGGFPTTEWAVTDYGRDVHTLPLLPGTPPGEYFLQVGVFPYGQPEHTLDVLDAHLAPAGRSAQAGTLQVIRPRRPLALEALAPQHRVRIAMEGGPALVGYDLPLGDRLQVGQELPLVLYWQAASAPGRDLEVHLSLYGDGGGDLVSVNAPPVPGYATSQWEAGDLWRGTHALLLPASLESGRYTLHLEGQPLAEIEITAPERLLVEPAVTYPAAAAFGELATLIGFDRPESARAGETLTVRLVWRADGETRTGYKSFVQVLDAGGRLIVSSDAVPGAWQRPTTGWVAGEYIEDVHPLLLPPDLAPGEVRLQAGLYDPLTWQRLTLPGGADALPLGTLRIER